MSSVPLLEGVSDNLKNGDLSRLVNAVGTGKYIVDELAETADCAFKRAQGDPQLERNAEALANATNAPKDKTRATLEESKNIISALKAKQLKLEAAEQLETLA